MKLASLEAIVRSLNEGNVRDIDDVQHLKWIREEKKAR
jgi:hypothetical protein